MRWNENTLRRAETIGAIVVVAIVVIAYVISKLH